MRGALDAIRVTELEGHSILILSPAVWCTITFIAISYGPYYFIGVRSSAHLHKSTFEENKSRIAFFVGV